MMVLQQSCPASPTVQETEYLLHAADDPGGQDAPRQAHGLVVQLAGPPLMICIHSGAPCRRLRCVAIRFSSSSAITGLLQAQQGPHLKQCGAAPLVFCHTDQISQPSGFCTTCLLQAADGRGRLHATRGCITGLLKGWTMLFATSANTTELLQEGQPR